MNHWTISGSVKNHGKRGSKFPVLWALVELDPVKYNSEEGAVVIHDNQLFLTIELNTSGSKEEKIGNILEQKLNPNAFIFASDCTVKPISRSKKKEDGSWENYKETGLAVKARNVLVADIRFTSFNNGIIEGKVIKQKGDKVLVEERYRIPGKVGNDAFGSRQVPLLLINGSKLDIENRYIYAVTKICGKDPDGKSSLYGVSTDYVIK